MLFVYNNLIANIDTIPLNNETEFLELDSLLSNSFEWPLDTILAKKDTLSSKKLSPNALSTSIKYLSQDSIIINLNSKRVYLFEAAKANYEDIELTAAFMDFGFTNSELYASGVADSCGHIHGPPIFKQGSSEFCSQEIRYNFNTKKGKVTKVITNEGEGFVHGRYVKHVDDKTSYIKDGQYTTCNLPHPHFQIRFSKAKVIQEEKIITGPAYMSFGNIPTPLAIPFGYFPLNKERSSGILMPRYGEGAQRGFYFEDFGYYFGISDRFDLQLRGDITTRGNWAAKSEANYVFRYKCNGNIFLSFAQNFRGERNTPMRERDNDFRVLWRHNQDPKAHPTTRFSAYVNVLSRSFSRNNPTSTSDYLSNEFASSLNFQTNANGIFYVDASVLYSQNTHNKNISVSLPELNMSVRQFYPFRKKHKVGKLKWYDNISLQWRSSLKNRISTKDSLFFKPQTWQEIQSGMQHNIPLTIPIKVGKSSNWNTNVTFTEKWHFQRNTKQFSEISIDTVKQGQINDVFQRGFYALHDLSMSTAFSTKVFFTYSFKKGDLKAIRHVLSPNLSFNYSPNLSNNAYGTYFNTLIGETVEYSYFTDGVSRNTRAIANVTLNNNLEMKVRSKKDSITGTRKVKLFDNISISCGYDFAADSLNWQPLLISGRTVLFSFMDVNFRLRFDPYTINNGRRVNKTELKVNKRLMRFAESDLNIGVNWHLNQDFFKGKKKENKQSDEPEIAPPNNLLGNVSKRPDFNNPWNITINYTLTYFTKDNLQYYEFFTGKKYKSDVIQTINIAGDISITRKWKIGFQTGYDIQQKEFSFTRIEIYRDLHCWEMKFHWIPFGFRKEWGFTINVKASVLQDLKYDLRRDFRDNVY